MTASLIDTNILIYANNEDSPFHSRCKALVEKAVSGKINDVYEIYTANSDHFKPFDSIKIINPLKD